jgi:nitrogen regulatory protein P-II 1
MKYIIAMIRPERLDAVKRELRKLEASRLTVSYVAGYGAQKGHLEIYKAMEKEANLLEKIKIEIAVDDNNLQNTIEAIKRGAKGDDGYIGSGKIFVLPLEDVIRIRTNENGPDAL